VRRSPPPPIFLEIDRAMRVNDIGRAVALAHRALDAGHSDAVLFNLRAHWRKENGMPMDALADLERARKLDPGSAPILAMMAECLNVVGHHKKALAAAEDALMLDTASTHAWLHKALAHQMLNQLDDAKTGYLEAVRRDPTMGEALARLGALLAQQGDVEGARSYADQVLALQPGNELGHLTHIMVDMQQARLDATEARIQSLVASPRTAPLTRANALSSLGDLRDRQDRPGEAFAAYRESKIAWSIVYGGRFMRPGQETVPQMVARLTDALA
jgi:tetratricopeptide (TPR) repeat protein